MPSNFDRSLKALACLDNARIALLEQKLAFQPVSFSFPTTVFMFVCGDKGFSQCVDAVVEATCFRECFREHSEEERPSQLRPCRAKRRETFLDLRDPLLYMSQLNHCDAAMDR